MRVGRPDQPAVRQVGHRFTCSSSACPVSVMRPPWWTGCPPIETAKTVTTLNRNPSYIISPCCAALYTKWDKTYRLGKGVIGGRGGHGITTFSPGASFNPPRPPTFLLRRLRRGSGGAGSG